MSWDLRKGKKHQFSKLFTIYFSGQLWFFSVHHDLHDNLHKELRISFIVKIALRENSPCKFKRWDDKKRNHIGIWWKPGAYAYIIVYINFRVQENFEIYHSWISQAYCAWKNKGKDLGNGGNVFTESHIKVSCEALVLQKKW